MNEKDTIFMQEALNLARHGITQRHGGPFGAVVVLENEIIGRGWNQVLRNNDPTAHAEVIAIRDACSRLKQFHLQGASLFTSCEPCPMCLSAAYWAQIGEIIFAADANDVTAIGFSDRRIRDQLQQPMQLGSIPSRQVLREQSLEIFRQWHTDPDRIKY